MKGSLVSDVLRQYTNPVFVETGTFEGAGVATAISCGFDEIHSIELHEPFFDSCLARFRGDANVYLHLGDSGVCLWDIIKNIDRAITFWLDGHIERDVPHGVQPIPILAELEQIGRHPIKSHTILIDDRRVMGTDVWFGITEKEVVEGAMKINSDYTIAYEDTCNAKNDIIVVRV